MECGDIRACSWEINAYCSGEGTGHVLLVNAENYDVYQTLRAMLEADRSKRCLSVSEQCTPNKLPNLEAICSQITGEDSYALIGLSQAAALRSAAAVKQLIGALLELPICGHGIVLLEHCEHCLREYMANDPRIARRVVLLKGNPSPLPRICLIEKREEGTHPIKNMKGLFACLERLDEVYVSEHPQLTVVTAYHPQLFSHSLYSVSACPSLYQRLTQLHPQLMWNTRESYGTSRQWKQLAKELQVCGSLSALAVSRFGSVEQLEGHIGEEGTEWLLWMLLKIFGAKGNHYLTLVLANSTSAEDFTTHLYLDLLELPADDDDFFRCYCERKRLLARLPEQLVLLNRYCSLVGRHEKQAVCYLTDASKQEERMFLRCLSTYDYTETELERITTQTFPELALYLRHFSFNECATKVKDEAMLAALTWYFEQYKLQKLTNRIVPEFMTKVEQFAVERPYNRLQARSSFVTQLPKEGTKLWFFDGLGVEFLSYIAAKCQSYGLLFTIYVGRCRLPSITEKNREFEQLFPDAVIKTDALDELKHHEQVVANEKCSEPVHLFRELEVIDRQLREIQAWLTQEKQDSRAVLVSDHGASRLAVLHNHENTDSLTLEEKGQCSGRCCPAEEDPHISCAAYEDGFSVLANYDRFKGGRRATVEVHGGAALEEVMVPVIVLTQKPEHIKICFIDPVIHLRSKAMASIVLFSTVALQEPKLIVNGITYLGVLEGDSHHARFVMPELKRTRHCVAQVYDGAQLLKEVLPFQVQRTVAKDTLEL